MQELEVYSMIGAEGFTRYADPNFLIPPTIEAVTVDGGAFNVRQGNNSGDLAASYIPREHFNSFVQFDG